jgi:hypothetical protein
VTTTRSAEGQSRVTVTPATSGCSRRTRSATSPVRASSIDRPSSVSAAASTAPAGTRDVPETVTSRTVAHGAHSAAQTAPASRTTSSATSRRRRRRRARTRAANRSADVGETVGRDRGSTGSDAT